MKRLVIAVDCDDVLVPSTHKIVEMYNQLYGTHVALSGAHASGNPDWRAPKEEVRDRIYAIQLMDEYASTRPFDAAIKVCHELAKDHELHLVTARPERIMHTTAAMLDRYFPGMFATVEHVGLDGDKGEVCRRLQADVLIDDNYKHLASAYECGVGGLVWFGEYPWQDNDEVVASEAVRCSNWYEVGGEIERIAG